MICYNCTKPCKKQKNMIYNYTLSCEQAISNYTDLSLHKLGPSPHWGASANFQGGHMMAIGINFM